MPKLNKNVFEIPKKQGVFLYMALFFEIHFSTVPWSSYYTMLSLLSIKQLLEAVDFVCVWGSDSVLVFAHCRQS